MSMSTAVNIDNIKKINELKIDVNVYNVLKETLYPGAKDESIEMVLNYCKARKLDPIKKPVHLVPMSVKTGKKDSNGKDIYEWRDIVMPGIGLYRIEADRSGLYAGMSEPEFGEDITEQVGSVKITYPKWCKITVNKWVGEKIVGFTAKEFWKENYATKARSDQSPNTIWEKRPYGQLAKCAEAQALRKAFPDVVGQDYTMEEMQGKSFQEDSKVYNETKSDNLERLLSIPVVDLDETLLEIASCDMNVQLQEVYTKAYKYFVSIKDDISLRRLIYAKDKRKEEISKSVKEFSDEMEDAEIKENAKKNGKIDPGS